MQDVVQHVLSSLEEPSRDEAHMRINYRTKGTEGVVRVSRGALAECFTVEFGGLRVHVDGVDATAHVVSSRIVDADRGEEVSVCLLLGDHVVYGPRPVKRPADASEHQGCHFSKLVWQCECDHSRIPLLSTSTSRVCLVLWVGCVWPAKI